MKYLGFLFVAFGIFVLATMVASDIQVILGAVLILGGLNLIKDCGCKRNEKDDVSIDNKG